MHQTFLHFLDKFPELGEEDRAILADHTPLKAFAKGTILLHEGEICKACYFVLKGCVRQYSILDGEEKTTAFFTEEQSVVSFAAYIAQKPSKHYLVCAEDCFLIMGSPSKEQEMYQKIPKLEAITRLMMEQDYGKTQEQFAAFMTASPEKRYLHLLENQPQLLHRVPQHQIASYLGITPESLSRIRKRLSQK